MMITSEQREALKAALAMDFGTAAGCDALYGAVTDITGRSSIEWAEYLLAADDAHRSAIEAEQRAHRETAECLGFVREVLEAHGIDMSRTPPMMYSNAVNAAIWKAIRGELPAQKADTSAALRQGEGGRMTDYWKPIPIVPCPDDVKPHVDRVIGLHISDGKIVAMNGMHIMRTEGGYVITSLPPEKLAEFEAQSAKDAAELGMTYRPLRAAVQHPAPDWIEYGGES